MHRTGNLSKQRNPSQHSWSNFRGRPSLAERPSWVSYITSLRRVNCSTDCFCLVKKNKSIYIIISSVLENFPSPFKRPTPGPSWQCAIPNQRRLAPCCPHHPLCCHYGRVLWFSSWLWKSIGLFTSVQPQISYSSLFVLYNYSMWVKHSRIHLRWECTV